jgi:hypothetical protein
MNHCTCTKREASVGSAGRRRQRDTSATVETTMSILTDPIPFVKRKPVSIQWTQEHGFSRIESIALFNRLNSEVIEVSRNGTVRRVSL